jgi:trehalose 6-phosphate synthase/phosphatase
MYFKQSVGGLATGLGSFYQSFNSKWIGWCGITSEKIGLEEKKNIETKLGKEFSSYPVILSRRHVELYYGEFCNKTLWRSSMVSLNTQPMTRIHGKPIKK